MSIKTQDHHLSAMYLNGEQKTGDNKNLGNWPNSSADDAALRQLRVLQAKLRRERAMGRRGHWAYDLSRHLALTQMVKETIARISLQSSLKIPHENSNMHNIGATTDHAKHPASSHNRRSIYGEN
ncbi:MAG: hypothetical protein AAGJ94_01135 [Pseudomonadota bacterium]